VGRGEERGYKKKRDGAHPGEGNEAVGCDSKSSLNLGLEKIKRRLRHKLPTPTEEVKFGPGRPLRCGLWVKLTSRVSITPASAAHIAP